VPTRLLLPLLDAFAVLGSLWLAQWVAHGLNPAAMPAGTATLVELMGPNPILPSGLALSVAWLGSLKATGGYDPLRMTSVARMLSAGFKSGASTLVFMMALHFALRGSTWARTTVLVFAGISTINVAMLRSLFFQIQSHLPSTLRDRRVAIVGTGEGACSMTERIHLYGHKTWTLAGFITPSAGTDFMAVNPTQVLGQLLDLAELVEQHAFEVVVIATDKLNREEHLILSTEASKLGVRVLQAPETWGVANPKPELAALGSLQLVDLTALTYPSEGAVLKRALDLVLVSIGGLLLVPLLLPIALLIRLSDGGPALFTQSRAGKGGVTFPMFKFRSMVVDAESQRDDLQTANESDGVLFKLKEDPRVTPLGRWLRRWSIDELPQLLNVLRGDMNLVGPRPLPVADLAGIERDPELMYWFTQRSKVKPGITGTWQVAKRGSLKMDDMIRLDIDYIQGWSLSADLVLLLRTIPAVTRRREAL